MGLSVRVGRFEGSGSWVRWLESFNSVGFVNGGAMMSGIYIYKD